MGPRNEASSETPETDYDKLRRAARQVLVVHSLPQYGERDHDLALEQLVQALR